LKFDKSKVEKILVIKPGAIGDVLLSTPVIQNLRHNFPAAKINFLTQSYCREVLVDNPYLTRVLCYDIGKGDSSRCLIKNIHDQDYDLIIDLFSNPRTAVIVFNSEAKYKVGYKFGWRQLAYNIKVKPRGNEVHNIEFNLDSLRALDLEIVTDKPVFILNKVHREFAERFFAESGLNKESVIGFNPSGTWQTKVWPAEKFIELGKILSKQHRILIFWGYEKEKEEAIKIRDAIGSRAIVIPQTNLKYLGALLEKCRLFVTNDTGPMHIAWVLGVPVAAIFGPTNSHLQGPLSKNSFVLINESLDCLGCNLTKVEDCPYAHKCMRELITEEVFIKINKYIALH
jgi:heptosyltransferase II